jgi:hypothetical protein
MRIHTAKFSACQQIRSIICTGFSKVLLVSWTPKLQSHWIYTEYITEQLNLAADIDKENKS